MKISVPSGPEEIETCMRSVIRLIGNKLGPCLEMEVCGCGNHPNNGKALRAVVGVPETQEVREVEGMLVPLIDSRGCAYIAVTIDGETDAPGAPKDWRVYGDWSNRQSA